jgi:hypothetical protein
MAKQACNLPVHTLSARKSPELGWATRMKRMYLQQQGYVGPYGTNSIQMCTVSRRLLGANL